MAARGRQEHNISFILNEEPESHDSGAEKSASTHSFRSINRGRGDRPTMWTNPPPIMAPRTRTPSPSDPMDEDTMPSSTSSTPQTSPKPHFALEVPQLPDDSLKSSSQAKSPSTLQPDRSQNPPARRARATTPQRERHACNQRVGRSHKNKQFRLLELTLVKLGCPLKTSKNQNNGGVRTKEENKILRSATRGLWLLVSLLNAMQEGGLKDVGSQEEGANDKEGMEFRWDKVPENEDNEEEMIALKALITKTMSEFEDDQKPLRNRDLNSKICERFTDAWNWGDEVIESVTTEADIERFNLMIEQAQNDPPRQGRARKNVAHREDGGDVDDAADEHDEDKKD